MARQQAISPAASIAPLHAAAALYGPADPALIFGADALLTAMVFGV
jgi:hypothetical protein